MSVFPAVSPGQRWASRRRRSEYPGLDKCAERDARNRMAPMNKYEKLLAVHVISKLKPTAGGYVKGYVDAYLAAARQWLFIVGQGWEVEGVDKGDFMLYSRGQAQLRKFLPSRQAASKKRRESDAGVAAGSGK